MTEGAPESKGYKDAIDETEGAAGRGRFVEVEVAEEVTGGRDMMGDEENEGSRKPIAALS